MAINIIKNYDAEITDLNNKTTVNRYTITTTEAIAENTDYIIPGKYKVGANVLEVYYMGEKLVLGTHYIEKGTNGSNSNKIQFKDWGQSVPAGRTLELIVRGVYN